MRAALQWRAPLFCLHCSLSHVPQEGSLGATRQHEIGHSDKSRMALLVLLPLNGAIEWNTVKIQPGPSVSTFLLMEKKVKRTLISFSKGTELVGIN